MIVWIIFGCLGCESSKCHHTQYFEDNAACRADRKLACCKHCPQQSRKARYRLHDAFGHNSCESTWVTLQRCNSGCFVRGLSERRTGYYGQANKLSAEGSLEGRESNPEVALCLPHRDYWICWRAAIQCRHNLQARIPVPNRSSDPRQRGWGSGLAGMIIKSFKNWNIVRKFRKLTRHKLGPIVTKSHHWRFCFERWEEDNGTADHWTTLQIRTILFWIVSSPPEIDLSIVRLRWPKVDFSPKTVLIIGSSNQNDPKWFDNSIVTIWSRHSDEHARLLCTSEGHTGKGHVKGAHGGLAVQRGRH